MPVRTLDQILAELSSAYDPQIANIRKRQELIPQQVAAEEQGLGAQQTQAFDQILGGARRRGLGFSGIPLAEQAQYSATQYMPALARLRQSSRDQAMSLEDAILGVNERRNTQAQQLQQSDYARDFQERQFAEQQRQFNEQQAAQQRAAASQGSALGALFGGGGGGAPAPGGGAAPNGIQKVAYDDVRTRVEQLEDRDLWSDYLATASSAKFGNQKDLAKLQVYRHLRPDLFKTAYAWEAQGGLKGGAPAPQPAGGGGWGRMGVGMRGSVR